MTLYIYTDLDHQIKCICSYNPFVVYIGKPEDRTPTYYTHNCQSPVDPVKQHFPELFL